jgi:amino acid adenylation domain-containing protein
MRDSRRLDSLLERSADRFPDQAAVEDPERCTLTYRQLRDTARLVSGVLAGAGVREGHRVGICAPKSAGTVAAIFGILHARAAYVPVDSSAPAERNAYIFDDCSVSALVTTPALLEKLNRQHGSPAFTAIHECTVPGDSGPPLLIAARSAAGAHRADAAPVDGLAYILYTSGSTGKPKGVMHSHSTALSFVDWCSEEFTPRPDDRFSSHAPFHFDLSILDLYVPIKHGATIVLIGEERGKQPLQLAELIASRRISVWYSTPSILRLLVEFGKLPRFEYPALRLVLFAGEVFTPKHQRAVRALWPHPTYYNLYGPTETNVCTFDLVSSVPPDDYAGPLPIGRTCSGDATRVIDSDGREVSRGQEGELLVSGGSVMLGYWNLPERNATAFAVDADGTRWYRTGDVVIEENDGSFRFLGRRDRMVKRRGYRVELGEIEAALHRHENISEAAVVALPSAESGVLIKAFVNWTGAGSPSMIDLKGIAAANLPAYMIPDRFVVLPALPKTSTDKVDYQKLREIG